MFSATRHILNAPALGNKRDDPFSEHEDEKIVLIYRNDYV
jgi:hypothetical protein